MRTRPITLAATLGLVGFLAASVAAAVPPAGGGYAGGGAGGGAAHAGGGAHGWSGSSGYRSANNGVANNGAAGYAGATGYANLGGGSYTYHGARGGYGVVGRESAGLGHGGAEPRGEHIAPGTIAVGPPTGSAAKATVVTDRRLPRPQPDPRYPLRPKLHEARFHPLRAQDYANFYPRTGCYPFSHADAATRGNSWAFDCSQSIKLKAR